MRAEADVFVNEHNLNSVVNELLNQSEYKSLFFADCRSLKRFVPFQLDQRVYQAIGVNRAQSSHFFSMDGGEWLVLPDEDKDSSLFKWNAIDEKFEFHSEIVGGKGHVSSFASFE